MEFGIDLKLYSPTPKISVRKRIGKKKKNYTKTLDV
jgi:hypothetical protein